MRLFINSLSGENKEQLIIAGLTYPNNLGLQSVSNVRSLSTFSYQASPNIWTIQDKTFISFTTNDADLNKSYLIVYDDFTGKCSDPIYTGITANRGDVHHFANIIQSSENKLLQMEDVNHGGAVMKQATSPDNFQVNGTWGVRSLTEMSGIGINVVYPHSYRLSDGSIRTFCRDASFANSYARIKCYSGTTGSTWNNYGDLVDWSDANATTSHIPYHGMIYSNDDILRIWVSDNHRTTSSVSLGWPYLFYIESHDNGITWRNAGNTFSKNIVLNGAITHAECVSNYVVIDQESIVTGDDWIRANTGEYNDGKIYIVSAIAGNERPHLSFWNGSIWTTNEITVIGYTLQVVTVPIDGLGIPIDYGSYNNKTQLVYKSNAIYFYGTVFHNSDEGRMVELKSIDNGLNWTLERFLTDGTLDVMSPEMSENQYGFNKKIFACLSLISGDVESVNLYINEL